MKASQAVFKLQKQSPEVFCEKKRFLKISQNSGEYNCVGVSFLISVSRRFCEIFKNNFFHGTPTCKWLWNYFLSLPLNDEKVRTQGCCYPYIYRHHERKKKVMQFSISRLLLPKDWRRVKAANKMPVNRNKNCSICVCSKNPRRKWRSSHFEVLRKINDLDNSQKRSPQRMFSW